MSAQLQETTTTSGAWFLFEGRESGAPRWAWEPGVPHPSPGPLLLHHRCQVHLGLGNQKHLGRKNRGERWGSAHRHLWSPGLGEHEKACAHRGILADR